MGLFLKRSLLYAGVSLFIAMPALSANTQTVHTDTHNRSMDQSHPDSTHTPLSSSHRIVHTTQLQSNFNKLTRMDTAPRVVRDLGLRSSAGDRKLELDRTEEKGLEELSIIATDDGRGDDRHDDQALRNVRNARNHNGRHSRQKHHSRGRADEHAGLVASMADQGAGDGSSVSANNVDSPDELKTHVVTVNLGQGSAFVVHTHPVEINTQHGQVKVAPGSVVYVVQKGKSVAIYDLSDKKTGDVRFVSKSMPSTPVSPGDELLVTHTDNKEFADGNPTNAIKSSNAKKIGEYGEVHAFNAQFSPVSALDNSRQFQSLANSTDPAKKALVNRILKDAAIVLTLRAGGS